MTVVTVCTGTVVVVARPGGADTVESAKAKAAAIEATLASTQAKMDELGQQYDAARTQLTQVSAAITTTKAAIAKNQKQVAKDKQTLEHAAIANYVSDGSESSDNPIFSKNEETLGAETEYNQIASGNLNEAVDKLHAAQEKLANQEAQLSAQQTQAQNDVSSEQAAINANQAAEQQQSAALSQENGEIATLVQQQEQQAAAAAAQASQAKLAAAQQQAAAQAAAAQSAPAPASSSSSSSAANSSASASSSSSGSSASANPPPPSAPGGAGAVQAAESQLGVPYVWGGESPGVGFDCSGLVQWAWAQAGVDLPRTSGEQFGATTPVSVGDLEPGDLLFYGTDGSEHVAMYIGGGSMIEAPHTGASVWITGVRLGDDFAGAGRP